VWFGGYSIIGTHTHTHTHTHTGQGEKDGFKSVASVKEAVLLSALWCQSHKKRKENKTYQEFGVFFIDNSHPQFKYIGRARVATAFPKRCKFFHILLGADLTVSTKQGYPFRLFYVNLSGTEADVTEMNVK